jgi:hypothetical protein
VKRSRHSLLMFHPTEPPQQTRALAHREGVIREEEEEEEEERIEAEGREQWQGVDWKAGR